MASLEGGRQNLLFTNAFRLNLPDLSKHPSSRMFMKKVNEMKFLTASSELLFKPYPHSPKAHHAQKIQVRSI